MKDIEKQIEEYLLNIMILKTSLSICRIKSHTQSTSSELEQLIKIEYSKIDQILNNQDNLTLLLISPNSTVRKIVIKYHNKSINETSSKIN